MVMVGSSPYRGAVGCCRWESDDRLVNGGFESGSGQWQFVDMVVVSSLRTRPEVGLSPSLYLMRKSKENLIRLHKISQDFANQNPDLVTAGALSFASRCHFNIIITSLKALDESFSSRNHVRKFLRALPIKWRSQVKKWVGGCVGGCDGAGLDVADSMTIRGAEDDGCKRMTEIPLLAKMDQRPFKFTNLLVHNSSFKNIVKQLFKSRVSRNRIEAILDSNGTLLADDQDANGERFVKYYETFLGQTGHTGSFNMEGLCRKFWVIVSI
ncbi:hypothetical protein Tco_0357071 [Tanacetum coccineum]